MTITIFAATLIAISLIFKTYAVCPVCTVAVGAGVGLSRWLGIDDTISGVWIGGLLLSSGLWLGSWVKNKYPKIKYPEVNSVALMYLLTIIPLYFANFFDPINTLWGINKLLLGTIIGTALFLLSYVTDKLLRKSNNGKVYIPYQRVILPVSYLALTSLVMFLITG